MLNKLFSNNPSKARKSSEGAENSISQKQKNSAKDIYIALSKYTSIGGKRFKVGLMPHISER
jgi:hypothetical protein